MLIKPCLSVDQTGWLLLREALWPHDSNVEHLTEMRQFVAQPDRFVQYMAYAESGDLVGMVETSLRTDYVNGTETSPVAFLEGIYVAPSHRRQAVARNLVGTVAEWAASRGCRELASDALMDNELSQAVHKSLGLVETERVVYFRKVLRPNDA